MNFPKIFSNLIFTIFFLLNFNNAQAGILSVYNDPPGCGGDNFMPNLVICGRSKTAVGPNCQQFTNPCNLGDLLETGGRVLVWIISFALLVVPLYVMWIGAEIIWYQKFDPNSGMLGKVKKRFREILIFFIFMLSAWLIVKLVIDIFQVDPRINTFMMDENGNTVKAKSFNTN